MQDFVTPIEESAAETVTQAAVPDKEPASNITAPAAQATSTQETPTSPPVPASAPAPPSPKMVPVELPPSPQTSQAPAAPAQNPTRGGPDSPSRMTMKDRLAFFAAAQSKPAPPPVKPKPAASGLTWSQRQKLRQEQETAEGAAAPAPPPAAPATAREAGPADPPAAGDSPQAKKKDDAGLSAADAVSSISKGGSLRERMAALQGAGAFGSGAEQPPAAPASSGKTWKRPPAPPAAEPDAEDEAGEDSGPVDKAETAAAEEGDAIAAAGEEVEGGDDNETEEEKEKARRAAIAARMAKLGARGPMGMAAPAKPARKPVKEAEVVSTPAEEQAEASFPTVDGATGEPDRASSPPASIPIPAVPRRTAPPRRRGPAPAATAPEGMPEAENVLESREGGIEPPPQVMVADEEKPLPKSEKQLEEEEQDEQLGQGTGGAEGATAAGIAMMPTGENELPQEKSRPQSGALTGESGGRRTNATAEAYGLGEAISHDAGGSQKSEGASTRSVPGEGDSTNDARQGDRQLSEGADPVSLHPIAMVPLHPPAPAETSGGVEDGDEDDEPPPPPPQRMSIVPKDEVVLKHEHDADVAAREQEDDASPAPAQRRPVSTDKPLGPRPLPPPGNSPMKSTAQEDRPLPVPPTGGPTVPLEDQAPEEHAEEEDAPAEEEDEDEEEEAPAPPPPRRQPSMPAPLQLGVPTPAAPQRSPTSTSPSERFSPLRNCMPADVPSRSCNTSCPIATSPFISLAT